MQQRCRLAKALPPRGELFASAAQQPLPQWHLQPGPRRQLQALMVWQRSAVRVVPAQQCLDGDDLAVGQLRQWLVVEGDLAGLQGAWHGSGQPAPDAMDSVLVRVERSPLSLPAALDAV